ncbi:TonB-dependent receptor [uncultured Eudoraea sp.]|uniref:TonB-dependent receptor n=1 Tax=uncultured Eudoraea sp. TaxID=1035614 RepID=UPI002634D6F9|nr:TonB-dependent receptor [uncultured Eudoraea sp.]
MQKELKIILITLISFVQFISAQDEKDLGTETVTVVRPYSPTVSDAFKLKSVPNLNDSIVLQKKKIEYSIFSIPVASTFTPAKGKAAVVQKAKPEKLYNSYASVSLGNFSNALADFYTSRDIDRGKKRIDFGLNHHSSRGDLEDVALDTDFYNTKLNATYNQKDRDLNWRADIGFQHRKYNWYGLPEGVFDAATINSINESQNYYNLEAGAQLQMEESVFAGGEVLYRRFWDAVESGENRFLVKPKFQFPVSSELVTLNVIFDYVGGSFKNASLNSTTNTSGIDYGQMQVGVNPNLELSGDSYTLNFGVSLVYGLDSELSDSNFYIYPVVNASYRLVDDSLIAYGGIEGALDQNSYYGYVGENQFVSPTLTIIPTDRKYDAFLGIKGQIIQSLSYNIRGFYKAENRKPLYKLNPENSFRTDEKGYYFGNSFEVFYDDIKTTGLFAELNVDINRAFTLGVNVELFDYNTETNNPAWNLPEVKGSLFLDYQIGKKWYLGTNLFYVGERQDLSSQAVENALPGEFPATLITLDSFFDANAYVGYHVNEHLSVFAKANNIANNAYQRWANFKVQSFQVLAGISYKFDF